MVTQRRFSALSSGCSIATVLLMIVSAFTICAEPIGERINLETWEAPKEMMEAFPYYVSGLDKKGQPVFVLEYGKWNVRKYLEDGGDSKILDTYVDHIILVYNRWSIAGKNLPSSDNSTGTGTGTGLIGAIVDFKGYESSQLTHIPSIAFAMEFSRKFIAPVTGPASIMDYGFYLNMNAAAKVLTTYFLAPILGDGFSKIKSFGTEKEEWIPLLLEKIPKSSLSVEFGGYPSFEPLAVFG